MSTLALGVHAISFAEYHSLEAWGSGSLRAMRRGPPARVLWERDRGRADTDATILGSAVHCALLTPELFGDTYAIKPEGMSFASKEGKAWRDDPVRAGRTLLSHDVGATVQAIVASLLLKTAVRESLEEATAREVSYLWECSITGERCKARPDWTTKQHNYDLKVSRHASGSALAYRAFAEGWFHQSAHYRTGAVEVGLPLPGSRLVVVEPVEPHFIHCLEIKAESLNILEMENIATLHELRDCRASGVFPGTPDEFRKIEIPANALAQMGDSLETEEEEEAA